jgi:hypothetical protein
MTSEIDYLPEIRKDVMLDKLQVKGAFPIKGSSDLKRCNKM